MDSVLLILRPEPGATATARRARSLGLNAVAAPIFKVRPLAWDAADPEAFDGLLLTSANAARHAGPALSRLMHLPCFTVGEATAAAAREAGLKDVRPGPADAAAAVAMAGEAGMRRLLHLCGRDHIASAHSSVSITRRVVYASDALPDLPEEAAEALRGEAVVLIHSARAGEHFASLAARSGVDRQGVAIAAMGKTAAAAVGSGWRAVRSAASPREEALLELAAELCKTGING